MSQIRASCSRVTHPSAGRRHTEADRNGDVKIVLESVKHINSVALDPAINTVDGSDAADKQRI